MIDLLCPVCRTPLTLTSPDSAHCPVCGNEYSGVLGILDLRGPGAVTSENEARITGLLIDAYPGASYSELVELRIRSEPNAFDAPQALIEHIAAYTATQKERGAEMVAMFHTRLAAQYPLSRWKTALDIGCGSGASLLAMAQHFEQIAGIDPGLPNLILASKALAEQQIDNVLLVQAYGQKLPFQDASFDYLNALNVLEHVFDLHGVLSEAARVLAPGGSFAADSRNRYDLFFPEPHVQLRWIGLLPREWAKRYVRRRCGIEYDSTYLLSYFDLKRGFDTYFRDDHRITYPDISAYGGPARLDRWLARIDRIPFLRELGLLFFPSHLILAHKPASKME
jgi:SAM-dependent methyltransferase